MKQTKNFLLVVYILFASALALAEDSLPFFAAEEFYSKAEMQTARDSLIHNNGAQINWLLMAERIEYQSNEGKSLSYSEVQGWAGTDAHRFWVKSEAESLNGDNAFEELELQALYSRPISTFFDAQIGLRRDFEPSPARDYAVLGIQGLAPYWFEIDLASFISDNGDVSFRAEFENDILLTQRLILQPRIEANFAVHEVKEFSKERGLTDFNAGLRLRYEIIREFAPYIGVAWNQLTAGTRSIAISNDEEVSVVSIVSGVRVWF